MEPSPTQSAQARMYRALCALLTREGASYRTLHHEPTLTSEESARARGEDVRIGGKALVVKVGEDFRLFVVSAARKLDSLAIKEHFAVKKLRFASPEELLQLTGLVPGSIPPFGKPLLPFELFVDTSILANEKIAFNAGSLTDSIIMPVVDYLRFARPKVCGHESDLRRLLAVGEESAQMERTPPIPVELWEQIPLHVRAVLWEVFARYGARLAKLEAEVAELKAQRHQNSQNSAKPPSSDGPHVKRKPPRPSPGRNPGGHPGHPAHHRAFVPAEQVKAVMVCRPTRCRRCGQGLQGSALPPHRHQVVELPLPIPQVTESQQQRLPCAHCGLTTCGALPSGVPTTGDGPRLTSIVA